MDAENPPHPFCYPVNAGRGNERRPFSFPSRKTAGSPADGAGGREVATGRNGPEGPDRETRKTLKTAGEAKSMGALIWWGLISLVILVLERETFFS